VSTANKPVPEEIRALSTMTDPGYVELFTMTSAIVGRSLEQWAEAMFEDVAAARRNADQWKSQTDRRRHHARASTHGT